MSSSGTPISSWGISPKMRGSCFPASRSTLGFGGSVFFWAPLAFLACSSAIRCSKAAKDSRVNRRKPSGPVGNSMVAIFSSWFSCTRIYLQLQGGKYRLNTEKQIEEGEDKYIIYCMNQIISVAICASSLVKQIKKCLKAGLELILKH